MFLTRTPLVDVADSIATAEVIPGLYGEPFGDPSAIPTHRPRRRARLGDARPHR
ncbi:MAG: hypothetical protein M3Q30_15055 [Actinomycetota bacterium]|nr:hypothetical protein [Actinomycetota bacterium]